MNKEPSTSLIVVSDYLGWGIKEDYDYDYDYDYEQEVNLIITARRRPRPVVLVLDSNAFSW